MTFSNREKLACFSWKRATLVGAGLLAVSAFAAPSQAADPIGWGISAKSMTLCSTMSADELSAAVQSGECASFLEQLGELAPAAGPETRREPIGDTPDSGPRHNHDGGGDGMSREGGGSDNGGDSDHDNDHDHDYGHDYGDDHGDGKGKEKGKGKGHRGDGDGHGPW